MVITFEDNAYFLVMKNFMKKIKEIDKFECSEVRIKPVQGFTLSTTEIIVIVSIVVNIINKITFSTFKFVIQNTTFFEKYMY